MIRRALYFFLDWLILSSSSQLSSKVLRRKLFPWRWWNIQLVGPVNCTGPIRIADQIPKKIGANFACVGGLLLGGRVEIGDNAAFNNNVFLVGGISKGISVGNNVLIGPNVVIRSANHNYADPDKPIREQGHVEGTIVIEDDVWLGANVVVTKDVRIGRGSVIGAGSVVTKDIPPFSVAIGIPAKVVSSRLKTETLS